MRTLVFLSMLLGVAAAQATSHLDPGKPPLAQQQAAQAENRVRPASVGATLDADSLRLLHASFEAADTAHRGTLTREQAQAGGFGWVTNHFDAIDLAHVGRVSFDDVSRYYRSRLPAPATNATTK
ncbi:MAG: EF-hand domain-containing protein [Burkholderiaceae bacterium]